MWPAHRLATVKIHLSQSLDVDVIAEGDHGDRTGERAGVDGTGNCVMEIA